MKTYTLKLSLWWILAACLLVTASMPLLAQSNDDVDKLHHLVPFGSPGTVPPANAVMVDTQQFLTLLNQGALQIASPGRSDQDDDRQLHLDQVHASAIRDFLRQHPNLTDLAQLVANNPRPADGLRKRGDGSWSLFLPATQSSVVTFGRSSKLTSVYDSVVFSTDRAANLKLYTQVYESLPGGYLESIDFTPVTPSQLANASLIDIQRAITTISTDWQSILPHTNPPLVIAFAGCQAEIGAGVRTLTVGDQSQNVDACVPGSKGLYANFDFPNKSRNTCVKYQGARGSCHSFAVTSATELQISLKHDLKVNLSEQDLIEHYRLLWQPDLQHEPGDAFEIANDMIDNHYSQPYESSWNYNPAISEVMKNGTLHYVCQDYDSGEPCSASAPEAPMVCTFGDPLVYCGYFDAGIHGSPYQIGALSRFWDPADPQNSAAMMVLSLAFNNSVVLTLDLTPGFATPTDGYVPYDKADLAAPSAGGHIVHVIGFIGNAELHDKLPDAPPASGGGYFIIKNSWGNCAGDGGYFYVPWDYVKSRAMGAFSISGSN